MTEENQAFLLISAVCGILIAFIASLVMLGL